MLSPCDAECRNNEELLQSRVMREMREQPRVIPGSDEGRPRTNERLLWVLLPPVSSPSIGNNLISIRDNSHQNEATDGLLDSDVCSSHIAHIVYSLVTFSFRLSSRPLMLMMKIILSNIHTEREHKYLHSHYLRCDSVFKTLVLTLALHRHVGVKFLLTGLAGSLWDYFIHDS